MTLVVMKALVVGNPLVAVEPPVAVKALVVQGEIRMLSSISTISLVQLGPQGQTRYNATPVLDFSCGILIPVTPLSRVAPLQDLLLTEQFIYQIVIILKP